MCDKCVELDGKIEHYERISASISDQLTIDRIKELVEQMKAQKSALHPEQEQGHLSWRPLTSIDFRCGTNAKCSDVRYLVALRGKSDVARTT
jgi:hypothetical protein